METLQYIFYNSNFLPQSNKKYIEGARTGYICFLSLLDTFSRKRMYRCTTGNIFHWPCVASIAPDQQSNLRAKMSADVKHNTFFIQVDSVVIISDCVDVQTDLELQCWHIWHITQIYIQIHTSRFEGNFHTIYVTLHNSNTQLTP